MNPVLASQTTAVVIGDMNGSLAYWGPAARNTSAQAAPAGRPAPELQSTRSSLARLARTVNGRTWTGTNALLSEAIGLPAAA